jgi:hypothetical protein
MVRSAIYRHTAGCVSGRCHAQSFPAMLTGIGD